MLLIKIFLSFFKTEFVYIVNNFERTNKFLHHTGHSSPQNENCNHLLFILYKPVWLKIVSFIHYPINSLDCQRRVDCFSVSHVCLFNITWKNHCIYTVQCNNQKSSYKWKETKCLSYLSTYFLNSQQRCFSPQPGASNPSPFLKPLTVHLAKRKEFIEIRTGVSLYSLV